MRSGKVVEMVRRMERHRMERTEAALRAMLWMGDDEDCGDALARMRAQGSDLDTTSRDLPHGGQRVEVRDRERVYWWGEWTVDRGAWSWREGWTHDA